MGKTFLKKVVPFSGGKGAKPLSKNFKWVILTELMQINNHFALTCIYLFLSFCEEVLLGEGISSSSLR